MATQWQPHSTCFLSRGQVGPYPANIAPIVSITRRTWQVATLQLFGQQFPWSHFPLHAFRSYPTHTSSLWQSFMLQLISRKIYASFLYVILYTEYYCDLTTVIESHAYQQREIKLFTRAGTMPPQAHCNLLHYHSIFLLGEATFYVGCCPNIGLGASITDHVHMVSLTLHRKKTRKQTIKSKKQQLRNYEIWANIA